MADDSATPAEDSPITFYVKSSNDTKYTLTLSPSTTVLELKNKLAGPDYADTPAERQRLIYSGRVLKDGDSLATHQLKDGHTIHLVKSAASNQRPAAAAPSAGTSQPNSTANRGIPGVPSNFAAGTGNNPLAGLTGARYAGFAQLPGAGMFGPDGGMGPPPDSEQMINMLENPQFQSTMNEALQNPQLIDMMIQQNPMLRDMGPGVRQMMQSPAFRRMLTDPSALRQMTQMQRAMGMGPFGQGEGAAGAGGFPAPGVTNTTPEENRGSQTGSTDVDSETNPSTQNPFNNPFAFPGGAAGNPFGAGNPFATLFGGNPAFGGAPPTTAPGSEDQGAQRQGGDSTGAGAGTTGGAAPTSNPASSPPPNPFAALFNPALFGQPNPQGGAGDGGTNAQQNAANPFANMQNNPFLQDPALFNSVLQAMGGQGGQGAAGATGAAGAGNAPEGANNAFASLWPGLMGGGLGNPPPVDNRPPEERYAEQLRQLNDMGFFEFERNIEALRRTGGSVQGAVEYLLNNP